jgi:hypothetical protein
MPAGAAVVRVAEGGTDSESGARAVWQFRVLEAADAQSAYKQRSQPLDSSARVGSKGGGSCS